MVHGWSWVSLIIVDPRGQSADSLDYDDDKRGGGRLWRGRGTNGLVANGIPIGWKYVEGQIGIIDVSENCFALFGIDGKTF
jgi:hypothetical protein